MGERTTPKAARPVVVTGRRATLRRVLIALVVLACIGGIALAANRTQTGEPDIAQSGADPRVVELFVPSRDSEVLRQAQIGIDLTSDFTGTLVVNGVEIPEDQLQRRPELNQIFFQPGEGQAIERLVPGRNCVQAIVWRLDRSRANARPPIEWCFRAT